MKTYKFYSDAGHGWLAVKRSELIDLGLIGKISHYSYQRGQTVYLEEDCDLQLFAQAKGCNAVLRASDVMKFDERHTDKSSSIRSYDSFRCIN